MSIPLRMSNRPQLIPNLIAVAVLLIAWFDWPYGYYTFLRLVVTCAAAWMCWVAFSSLMKVKWLCWVFGLIVLLFNPFVLVHFDRETWRVIDVIAAIVFAAAIVPQTAKEPEHQTK